LNTDKFAAKTAKNPLLVAELTTFFASKPVHLQGGGGASASAAAAAAAAVRKETGMADALEAEGSDVREAVAATAGELVTEGRPRRKNAGRCRRRQ